MKKSKLIKYLMKNKVYRTKEETNYILKSISSINFFKNEYDKIYHPWIYNTSKIEYYNKLIDLIKIKLFKQSEKVYRFNSECDKIYIIHKGSLDIYMKNMNNYNTANINLLFNKFSKNKEIDINLIKNNKNLWLLYNNYKEDNLDEFKIIYDIFIYTNKLTSNDLLILNKEMLNNFFDKYGNFWFLFLKNLKKNKLFGEFDIHKKNIKRKDTAVCLEDSIISYFEINKLKDYLYLILKQGLTFYFEKYMKKLSVDNIEKILLNIEFKELKLNQSIFNQNDVITDIYMVYKGEIGLYKTNENNDFNYKKELHKTLNDFEFFGFSDSFKNRYSLHEAKILSHRAYIIIWEYENFKYLLNTIKPLRQLINLKVMSLKDNFKKKLLKSMNFNNTKKLKSNISYRLSKNEILFMKKKSNFIKIKKSSIDLNKRFKSISYNLKFKKKIYFNYLKFRSTKKLVK